MHQRLIAGVRADAVKQVIVAERRHLNQLAFADERRKVCVVCRQTVALLTRRGDLYGEKAPPVAVVLQLGWRIDRSFAACRLAAFFFDLVRRFFPGIDERRFDSWRWRLQRARGAATAGNAQGDEQTKRDQQMIIQSF